LNAGGAPAGSARAVVGKTLIGRPGLQRRACLSIEPDVSRLIDAALFRPRSRW
jgi:hypothetical protein